MAGVVECGAWLTWRAPHSGHPLRGGGFHVHRRGGRLAHVRPMRASPGTDTGTDRGGLAWVTDCSRTARAASKRCARCVIERACCAVAISRFVLTFTFYFAPSVRGDVLWGGVYVPGRVSASVLLGAMRLTDEPLSTDGTSRREECCHGTDRVGPACDCERATAYCRKRTRIGRGIQTYTEGRR